MFTFQLFHKHFNTITFYTVGVLAHYFNSPASRGETISGGSVRDVARTRLYI